MGETGLCRQSEESFRFEVIDINLIAIPPAHKPGVFFCTVRQCIKKKQSRKYAGLFL
ncbi:hypothetical protein BAC3_01177 [uncultured bacterium]|nr:hypothetical protein BAC3_01177 [uncultured bacterium]